MPSKNLKKKIEDAKERLRIIQADHAALVEQHRQLAAEINARSNDYLEAELELKTLHLKQRKEGGDQ